MVAAATAYYATDSLVRDEPLGLYLPELLRWWLAGVAFGSLLGGVGAYARRPDALGVLARLVVPAGAIAQMVLDPPSGASGASAARLIVLAAAAMCAAAVVTRFLARERHDAHDQRERVAGSTGRKRERW